MLKRFADSIERIFCQYYGPVNELYRCCDKKSRSSEGPVSNQKKLLELRTRSFSALKIS